jgi:hypothetical protein
MRHTLRWAGLLAIAVLLLFGWYYWPTSTKSLRAGDASIYPDTALTPGDIIPGVTAADVCTPYYTQRVRSVNSSEREVVYRNYKIVNVPKEHELDHFISLELGGSNAASNLWPEAYEPRPGAHEKDRVENYLHRQVCSGKITLEEAQREIVSDWYAVYLTLPPTR